MEVLPRGKGGFWSVTGEFPLEFAKEIFASGVDEVRVDGDCGNVAPDQPALDGVGYQWAKTMQGDRVVISDEEYDIALKSKLIGPEVPRRYLRASLADPRLCRTFVSLYHIDTDFALCWFLDKFRDWLASNSRRALTSTKVCQGPCSCCR